MLLSLEGNIGSGKSTLLQRLKTAHPEWIFLDEPVESWKTVRDTNNRDIIECFYSDQEKYAFSFQILAYITRLKKLLDAKKKYDTDAEGSDYVMVTERSIDTDHFVFAKMLYDDGKISKLDWQIYQEYIQTFTDQSQVDAIVYVETAPETCLERIEKRNRDGESSITSEYLEGCHRYHQQWLQPLIESKVTKAGDSSVSIYRLDASYDTSNEVYWEAQLSNITQFVESRSRSGGSGDSGDSGSGVSDSRPSSIPSPLSAAV